MPYKILILTEVVVKKKNYIKNFKILGVKSLEIKTMTEVLTYYMFL